MSSSKVIDTLTNLFLPVTALKTVPCAGSQILLAGTGGTVEAISLENGLKLCDSGLILTQTIKHIIPFNSTQEENEGSNVRMLVQGGSQIAWLELRIEKSERSVACAHFRTVCYSRTRYWMICGRPSMIPGIAATFLTSYNALLHVKIDTAHQILTLVQLNHELTTFLYSGDFVEVEKHRYLVSSGTAFGQILVWSCEFDEKRALWLPSPWREFQGHQGSIFGVSISNRFQIDDRSRRITISCSDDRTIRIWDISDIPLDADEKLQPIGTGERGQSMTYEVCNSNLAETWAHASRIWNVDFISTADSCEANTTVCVVSTGEDATAQSWYLNINSLWHDNSPKHRILCQEHSDNHHAGKNIWSRYCSKTELGFTFYTGAADGGIVARPFRTDGYADNVTTRSSQTFQEISSVHFIPLSTFSLGRKSMLLRSYMILSSNEMLATTDTGLLLRGCTHEGTFDWQILHRGKKSEAFLLCSKPCAGSVFLINNSNHALMIYNVASSELSHVCSLRKSKVAFVSIAWSETTFRGRSSVCLSVSYFGIIEHDLIWLQRGEGECSDCSTSTLHLPPKFEVTSTCYNKDAQMYLAGSREGTIAVYNSISSTHTSVHACWSKRSIHGTDAVTSIRSLGNEKDDLVDSYLTTGRDGSYCIIQIVRNSLMPVRIVHQVLPPMGPNIEGANIVVRSDGNKRVLLYGFKSTDFVVWDETHQTRVMSVRCGGAHRNWDFSLDETTGEGGTFAWTQAGSLQFYQEPRPHHKIIRHGGHGREIKALAITYSSEGKPLIATGSEDTNICIFELTSPSPKDRRAICLATLRRHNTGLQDLRFSRDGKYLFSAAGMEELYAWKLTPVPVIKQGVCFAGSLPAQNTRSDARIMSLDTLGVVIDAGRSRYTLIAAFSNGRCKVIEYIGPSYSDTLGVFSVIDQIDLGAICLTQAQFLDARLEEQQMAVVAATNGIVNICAVNNTADSQNAVNLRRQVLTTRKIHQNSITALRTVRITSSIQLLVTGGDDNALAISLQYYSTDANNKSQCQTMVIPKVHAAALTAVDTLVCGGIGNSEHVQSEVLLVTAGNDQRVKVWKLHINMQAYKNIRLGQDVVHGNMDNVGVELLVDVHTNVADISEIAILQAGSSIERPENGVNEGDLVEELVRSQRLEVIVVGVGMEIVGLDISL